MDRFKLGVFLLASLLILSGLLIFYYLGQTLKINCFYLNEEVPACTTQAYWFNLWPVTEVEQFSPVLYASVESGCNEQGRCYYKLLLHTPNQIIPLDSHFFNNPTALEAEDKINQFLQKPDASALELYPTPLSNTFLYLSCVGMPFLLLGALLLWGQWSEWAKWPNGRK